MASSSYSKCVLLKLVAKCYSSHLISHNKCTHKWEVHCYWLSSSYFVWKESKNLFTAISAQIFGELSTSKRSDFSIIYLYFWDDTTCSFHIIWSNCCPSLGCHSCFHIYCTHEVFSNNENWYSLLLVSLTWIRCSLIIFYF